MADQREELLEKHLPAFKLALDEYFTEMSMELLDYISFRVTDIKRIDGLPLFKVSGEWVTKEALFQNFL